jgi:cyclophilin family peptidyl-prolyl cis-trans isomerase
MRLIFRAGFVGFILAGTLLSRAQLAIPTLSQPIPLQRLGALPVTLDLRNFYGVPGVTGQVVQIATTSGRFNVEVQAADAPRNVTNFLSYVNKLSYDNTVIHAISNLGTITTAVVRGGGYSAAAVPPTSIARDAAVPLEYKLPNVRGTLAAMHDTDINSATCEWFINTHDNSSAFAPGSGVGYTVFGRVLGTGMSVVDAIGQIPSFSLPNTIFNEIPLRNVLANQTSIAPANYVGVTSLRVIPIYATTSGETSVLGFTSASTNEAIVNVSVIGSTLTLRPLAIGNVNVTVRATDTNGNFVDGTFAVTVPAAPLVTPLFTAQPVSQTVISGTTTVISVSARGAPTYQWVRNGVLLNGATSAILLLTSATAAQAGTYTCVATNVVGSTTSAPATLAITTEGAYDPGRLTNLSVLGVAGSGNNTLTVGAVVGPRELSGNLLLVARAVGPTLETAFGLPGTLPDPQFLIHRGGVTAPIASNDNWGGSASLSSVFDSVGAFKLPATSLDSANLVSATAGSYTVQVIGKDTTSGVVLTEIYDASGVARTATTPRLINVSTLKGIEEGDNLAAGFVIGGKTPRTVLIRGVGPSLEVFGVPNAMVDPKLEVYDNGTSQKIGENDDWGGEPQLSAVGNSVGAFSLAGPTTKDAVILMTLPPGGYTARVTGAGFAPGNAIIEIYEVR